MPPTAAEIFALRWFTRGLEAGGRIGASSAIMRDVILTPGDRPLLGWLATIMARSETCEHAVDRVWAESQSWPEPEADCIRSVLHSATFDGRQAIIEAIRTATQVAGQVREEIGLDPPGEDPLYDLGEPI